KDNGEAAAKQRIAMLGLKLALTDQLGVIEKEMMTLELVRKRLMNRYGSKHPDVLDIEEQLQLYKDKMARPGMAQGTSDKKVMPLDSVEAVISALESEIAA